MTEILRITQGVLGVTARKATQIDLSPSWMLWLVKWSRSEIPLGLGAQAVDWYHQVVSSISLPSPLSTYPYCLGHSLCLQLSPSVYQRTVVAGGSSL